MPTVPRPERQVTDAPVPGVRLGGAPSPESFGAGVGDTMIHVGARLYNDALINADRTATFEADRQTADLQTSLEQKIRQTKGKNVLGLDAGIKKDWDEGLTKIEAGLTSDRQRLAFDRIKNTRSSQLNALSQSHFSSEMDRFQDQETTAGISSAIDRIRANAGDPSIRQFEMGRIGSITAAYSVRKGHEGVDPDTGEAWTTDLAKQFRAQAFSSAHKETIVALNDQGRDLDAGRYFEANKDKLTAQDRDAVEKSVTEGTTRGQSRRLAEELISTHGIDTPDQRKAVLEGIKGIQDDKVADLTRQRVEHEFSTHDQLKNAQAQQNFLNASQMIDETWKSSSQPAREMLPVSVWNSLTPNEQHTLELKTDRLRAPVVAHDSGVWFKFKTMQDEDLAKLSPAKLMGDYLNKFDKEHYDRALNEYNAAINVKAKKDKAPEEKFVSALTTRERIRNSFNLSGVAKDPKKLTTEEAIWFDRFETSADKALSKLPKDATPEQIDKVLSGLSDGLLKQKYSVDPGAFRFNKDVPAIGVPDMKDPRSIRVPMKEIPPDRQNALRGALKQAGLPVTEQAIEELEAKSRIKRSGVQ